MFSAPGWPSLTLIRTIWAGTRWSSRTQTASRPATLWRRTVGHLLHSRLLQDCLFLTFVYLLRSSEHHAGAQLRHQAPRWGTRDVTDGWPLTFGPKGSSLCLSQWFLWSTAWTTRSWRKVTFASGCRPSSSRPPCPTGSSLTTRRSPAERYPSSFYSVTLDPE